MKSDRIRGHIALIVIVVVLATTSFLAIAPVCGGLQNAADFQSVLKDYGSLFAGIVGTIVGYYFAKKD
jgi:hypothetical protein